jgi:hemoglobin/transferrin/lactoferrin receptor protein
MVRRPYPVDGKDSILYEGNLSKSFAIQNAAFTKILGTHIGMEVNLRHGFYTGAKLNFQYGIEEMENGVQARSRHAAPSFGEFKLGYHTDKLDVEFYCIFSDQVSHQNLNPDEIAKSFIYAKDTKGNPFSPSWYTLNLKARYKIFKYLSINAGVENIADLMYRPYSSGIAAAGRNIVFSVSTKF